MNGISLARRALALFDDALDQPAERRDAWIHARCDGDTLLEREVHLLLEAASTGVGILDRPSGAQVLPNLEASLAPAIADRYTLGARIGKGGMGSVYRARAVESDREVVIKALSPTFGKLFGAERFLREIRIAASLSHPNIVPLIDSDEVGGFLYYTMPWMDGRSLRELLADGKPPRAEALRILGDVAEALIFAHAAGVIHRDLKPENILLADGRAYLLDFGIAKLRDSSQPNDSITAPGLALGTRRYMAPEQNYAAADADARADVFAWGLLATELLTGVAVKLGDTPVLVRKALELEGDVPQPLIALCVECVALQRERRIDAMTTVRDRLADVQAGVAAGAPAAPTATASTGGSSCLGRTAAVAAVVAMVLVAGHGLRRPVAPLPPTPQIDRCASSGSADSTGRLCFTSAKSPATRL